MKRVSWVFAIPAAMAVILVSALVVAADVPAGKEEVVLNALGGKQGPVKFPHAKHVKEFKKKGGAAIVCKDCHHTLKADAPGAGEKAESCATCHVKPGEAEKEIGGKKAPAIAVMKGDKADMKSVIYHKECADGCHKDMKAEGKNITVCKTCHQK